MSCARRCGTFYRIRRQSAANLVSAVLVLIAWFVGGGPPQSRGAGETSRREITVERKQTLMTFGPPTLIASDVDGTLIDDENRVSPRTLAVLVAATTLVVR